LPSTRVKGNAVPSVLPQRACRCGRREQSFAMSMQALTPQLQQGFQIGRSFSNNTKEINSIAFSPNGETLVTSSDDDSINIYNCKEGVHQRPLYSKKYGATLIEFTHADNTVLHASSKEDDQIRYLSLHDNKYIRYFSSHKDKVTSINMSPTDDTFLTCSKDKTIRVWDLRTPGCQGSIPASTHSAAAYDPQGMVFGTGWDYNSIRLYDSRQYEKGPFLTTTLENVAPQDEIKDVQFSGDGLTLLVLTQLGFAHLLNAFDGSVLHRLGSAEGQASGDIVSACFTPCGQFLYGGTQEGRINVWDVKHGVPVAHLSGHSDTVNALCFNPKYMMFASGCASLAMWLPDQAMSQPL